MRTFSKNVTYYSDIYYYTIEFDYVKCDSRVGALEVLCYIGLNLSRFVWRKMVIDFIAEIFIFFCNENGLPQCLVSFAVVIFLLSSI